MRPFAKHRLLSGLLALLVLAAAAAAVLGASHAAANQKPATLPVKAEPKPGITVYQNAKASVDASNLSEGYVMVRYTGGKQVRIKVLITGENGVTGSVYWIDPGYYVDGVGSSVLLDDQRNLDLFSQLADGSHAPGTVGTLAENQ